MLNTLKHWWSEEDASVQKTPELSLAITKLMVGMMNMDGRVDDVERKEILYQLALHYDLNSAECDALIEECIRGDAAAMRFDSIVKQIKNHFDVKQRTEILRQLWQVALADNEIDFLEEQYINRLSGLLGVPVEALLEAKQPLQRGSRTLH